MHVEGEVPDISFVNSGMTNLRSAGNSGMTMDRLQQ